jgi:hypothetical protein
MSVTMLSTYEAMRLWGELVEAAHGVNTFGGDTAELYAYRFSTDSPAATLGVGDAVRTQAIERGAALYDLLSMFAMAYTRRVEVDGERLTRAMRTRPFVHRVHVKVGPAGKRGRS